MTALYELTNEYCELFQKLSEDGFDIQTIEDTLNPIAKTFEEKAKNVVCYINNINSDLEELENHKKNVTERITKRKKEIDFFREYIKQNMIIMNLKSIKCPLFDITIKNSMPKLIKEDEMSLPSSYIKTEIVTKIDDAALKSDLKNGLIIPGAYLEETKSLTITLK